MRGIVFLLFINEAILRAKKTFRVCRGWSSGPPGTFLRLEVDKSDNISMVGHLCSEHDGGRQKHDEIKRLYDSEQFYYAAEYHSSRTQYFVLRKMLCDDRRMALVKGKH